MNYIYMYINKTNNKKYIGQTNNFERRIREHRSIAFNKKSGNYNDYFHMALRKHTENNFEIQVLWSGHNTQKELDELEIQYIQDYKAHVSQWGYNLTWGGQGTKKSSYYENFEDDIKTAIRNNVKYKDIQEKFGCSPSFISSINHGLRFYNPNENYPINKFHYFNADDIYPQMICLLQDPRYRFQEIANKLNCSYATVKSFNNGSLQKGKYWHGEYPIRDRYFCERPKWYQCLELLRNTTLPIRVIARDICHISDKVATDINRGVKIPQPNISYPIR